jgi:hypothetical protein
MRIGPTSSAMGLGRVKTPTCNLRVEIPSRFRQLENQKYLRPLLGEDDRENNSAHSWLVHVFTQPGSKAEVISLPSISCHAFAGIAGGRAGERAVEGTSNSAIDVPERL